MGEKLDLKSIDPQKLDPEQEKELLCSLSDEELADAAGGIHRFFSRSRRFTVGIPAATPPIFVGPLMDRFFVLNAATAVGCCIWAPGAIITATPATPTLAGIRKFWYMTKSFDRMTHNGHRSVFYDSTDG